LFRWMRRPDILLGKMHAYDGHLDGKVGGFKKAVMDGNLPEYTFIDPRYFDWKAHLIAGKPVYANDDHPPHDLRRGQLLIQDVYETLRAGPLWESTLLIITYDEHGGYYDHVPPPSVGIPNPDGKVGDGMQFDRLGVRVPTVMISPWIQKGTVIHSPRPSSKPFPTSEFEHSSVAATIKKLFGLPSFLTKRDAWAGTFEEVWSVLPAPRTDCPMTIADDIPTLNRRQLEDQGDDIDPSAPLTDSQAALVEIVRGLRDDPMTMESAMEDVDDGDTSMTQAEALDFVRRGLAEACGQTIQ